MMVTASKLPFIQADYHGYPASIASLKAIYLDFPRNVGIETQVKCNAKCSFCPYPTSPRQGQEMSDELFHKIVNDLSRIPHSHSFGITLHRINEPLLDRRMLGFCQLVAEKLPSANQQFWTNGTMLKEGAFEWMTQYARASLTISLNSVNEEEHVRLMGFGLESVFRGLDYLHRLTESRKFTLPVALCAPFQNEEKAAAYQAECSKRWPLFKPAIRPFFQWMGASDAGGEHRLASGLPSPSAQQAAKFACGQWFDLHILANGYVTKCCIDETGYAGEATFDALNNNVLDIYQAARSKRANLPPRREAGCEGCFHLG